MFHVVVNLSADVYFCVRSNVKFLNKQKLWTLNCFCISMKNKRFTWSYLFQAYEKEYLGMNSLKKIISTEFTKLTHVEALSAASV